MRRSGIRIMAELIGLIAPLMHVMILAITTGVLGFLCAISYFGIFSTLISPVSNGRKWFPNLCHSREPFDAAGL